MNEKKKRGLRGSVRWFAGEMEARLKAHDDRPGWTGESFRYLLFRISQELGELVSCFSHPIAEGETEPTANMEEIKKEAADVANFAMMIADNVRRDKTAKGGSDENGR